MSKIRPEDLGGMGQSFFENLCKNAGLIANPSKDDKGGWDFEIEHPRHTIQNYSKQSYPVYRVQVKATQGKESKFDVTYSNLLNLIQYSGAAFIFLAMYSGGILPDKIYLFHIDENFSREILKEIRQKQLKDFKFVLNKRKRRIWFRENQEITQINGEALRQALEQNIGANYLRYVENKIVYLLKLEKESNLKQFTLSNLDLDQMINCFLGYEDKICADIESYHAPFEIRDPNPYSIHKKCESSLKPISDQLQKTTVYLKSTKFGRYFKFNGVVYTLPPFIPKEFYKIRIRTTFFDFLIENSGIRLYSKDIYASDTKYSIKDIYYFLCFIDETSRGDNKLYIKFEKPDHDMPVELCLQNGKNEMPNDFDYIFKTIKGAYKKLQELNLIDETISGEAFYDQLSQFYLLSIINQQLEQELVFEFCFTETLNLDAEVIIFKSMIYFEKTILASSVACFGSIEKVRENTYLGRFNKIELLGQYVLDRSSNVDEVLEEDSKKYQQELIQRGYKL